MEVKTYNQYDKNFLRKLMSIDTGSGYNFILRSVIEELGLHILGLEARDLNCFASLQFQVDQAVTTNWQFSPGENIYHDFVFYVLSEIPGGSIVR